MLALIVIILTIIINVQLDIVFIESIFIRHFPYHLTWTLLTSLSFNCPIRKLRNAGLFHHRIAKHDMKESAYRKRVNKKSLAH